MTPYELRRLASRKLAEATELAVDADRLRAQAAALQGLLEPIVPISQRVWTGPAADDFETQVRSYSHQVNEQSAQLTRIAAGFDDEAARLRRESGMLRAQASVAEAEAAAAAAGAPLTVVPRGVN